MTLYRCCVLLVITTFLGITNGYSLNIMQGNMGEEMQKSALATIQGVGGGDPCPALKEEFDRSFTSFWRMYSDWVCISGSRLTSHFKHHNKEFIHLSLGATTNGPSELILLRFEDQSGRVIFFFVVAACLLVCGTGALYHCFVWICCPHRRRSRSAADSGDGDGNKWAPGKTQPPPALYRTPYDDHVQMKHHPSQMPSGSGVGGSDYKYGHTWKN